MINLLFLIIAVVFVSAVVYAYLQVYQPLVKDTKQIESSIATVTNEVSTLGATKKVDTTELLTNTANLQKKLPVAELADQFVILLEKAEVASGSRIMSIAFNKGDNTDTAANNTAEQNLSQAVQNAAGSTSSASQTTTTTTTTTALPAGVKKLTATLSVEAPSYLELEAFIKELEALPRITKVDSLSFSGVAEGDKSNVLTYTVVASTYYYPDLTDLKSQVPDYEAPVPSKKTNPLYEAKEEVITEAPQANGGTNVDPTNETKNVQVKDNSQTNSQKKTRRTIK